MTTPSRSYIYRGLSLPADDVFLWNRYNAYVKSPDIAFEIRCLWESQANHIKTNRFFEEFATVSDRELVILG